MGQRCLEADEGAAWLFLRLWRDQAVAFEDAPDRGHRGDLCELQPKVLRDRVRSVVVAGGVQLLAQRDDGGLDLGGHRVGAGLRTS